VTIAILILAIPLVIIKFIVFVIKAMGSPLKSVKHLLAVILAVIILAGLAVTYEIFYPRDIGEDVKSVMVRENDTFATAMQKLKENEILHGDYFFKLLAVWQGIDKSLAPGRYDFKGGVSQYEILKKLKNRDIATAMVTIPEGLPGYRISGIIGRLLGNDSTAFDSLVYDTAFARQKFGYEGLEGYLFPETYLLWYGMKNEDIIEMMVSEFEKRTAGLYDEMAKLNLSPDEILTLASIIEAEAMYSDEMEVISSVYHNRLKRRMRLQADPTVIYALGGLDRPLLYRDLRIDSPYNTYKNYGLPPGPINSPGLDAIRAAINPAVTDYLYFVADGKGRHIFTTNLRDHNRAKYRIKRESRLESGS